MIRVDIIDSSPIFMVGLVRILSDAGIRVLGAKHTVDEQVSWLADAIIVDPDVFANQPTDVFSYISERARSVAVLVLCAQPRPDADRYLAVGASAVVSKQEPSPVLVRTIRNITAAP